MEGMYENYLEFYYHLRYSNISTVLPRISESYYNHSLSFSTYWFCISLHRHQHKLLRIASYYNWFMGSVGISSWTYAHPSGNQDLFIHIIRTKNYGKNDSQTSEPAPLIQFP